MSDASGAATAPDPRPRPQYGEYATPEEQRARIREPRITQALETGQAPETVVERAAPTPTPEVAPARPLQPGQAAPTVSKPRAVDRIITFALLAYGLVNLISSFPALVDFASYAETMFGIMGVEVELTDPAAGRPWGIAAALVLAVGWFVTAAVSWWNMRRGRLSWWIPLVGGLVFTFISGVLMVVPLMNDPAVWEALVGR